MVNGSQYFYQLCKHVVLSAWLLHSAVESKFTLEHMDSIAANLDLATAGAYTDLNQYINSDLVFSDLKF